MQDIKFKAYVPELRKTVDVFAVNPMNQTVYLSSVHLFGTPGDDVLIKYGDEPDQVKLRRYTGLKDKNGVEIYEGDVVRILYTDWISKDDSDRRSLEEYLRDIALIRLVEWSYNGFYVTSKPNGWHESMEPGTHGYIEVIGNIYENPELLTNAA